MLYLGSKGSSRSLVSALDLKKESMRLALVWLPGERDLPIVLCPLKVSKQKK